MKHQQHTNQYFQHHHNNTINPPHNHFTNKFPPISIPHPNNHNSHNIANIIDSYSHDKDEETIIICFADAGIEPYAMMIELVNASM